MACCWFANHMLVASVGLDGDNACLKDAICAAVKAARKRDKRLATATAWLLASYSPTADC